MVEVDKEEIKALDVTIFFFQEELEGKEGSDSMKHNVAELVFTLLKGLLKYSRLL